MCHANLDFDAKTHYGHFPTSPPISGRVFTLSQGQQDIHFPPGMGIPVRSDLQLSLATQVLNLNIEDPDLNVRHKVEIEFVRDSDLEAYRRQARQAQMRQAMRPQVAASAAFDVMRRRQQAAAATAPPEEKQEEPEAKEAEAEFTGVGRNDPCPCGSGKKFKKCHGSA